MKFSNLIKASVLALAATLMVGCGERVEVPPGFVGKVMTKDGYQEGLIPTSKLRLAPCMNYCDRMVIMDNTDKSYVEPMQIFIPADKLNITVDLRATLAVDPLRAEPLFNKLPQVTQGDYLSVISGESIYNTYGKQVLQAEVRSYLTKYSISEIASNGEKINSDIQILLSKVMGERTPFNVRYAGLTNIKYPTIITDAQENSAKRREMIAQEEASLSVSKVKLDRELQEAKMQRAIEKEKAETEAQAQRVLAEAVDPRSLRIKELEIEKIKAEKWDGRQPQTLITNGSGQNTSLIMDIRKQQQ
ncbi:hypothetical protein D3C75_682020 [compost metagenome]